MKVKVGFSTSNSLVSRIIRWATGSKVSHTWLLLEDMVDGVSMVMQATGQGFQLITYERFLKGSTVVDVIDPKQPIDVGVKDALQWLGEPYDTVGLVGMAWVELGRLFKRNWRNWLHSSSAMWCSESCIYVMQAAKYPGADKLVPSQVSPEDLLEFMKT